MKYGATVKVTRMRNAMGRGGQIPGGIQSVDRGGSNSFMQSKLNTGGLSNGRT